MKHQDKSKSVFLFLSFCFFVFVASDCIGQSSFGIQSVNFNSQWSNIRLARTSDSLFVFGWGGEDVIWGSNEDLYLNKVDRRGNVVWKKRYGILSRREVLVDILSYEENIFVFAKTDDLPGTHPTLLLKIRSQDGQLLGAQALPLSVDRVGLFPNGTFLCVQNHQLSSSSILQAHRVDTSGVIIQYFPDLGEFQNFRNIVLDIDSGGGFVIGYLSEHGSSGPQPYGLGITLVDSSYTIKRKVYRANPATFFFPSAISFFNDRILLTAKGFDVGGNGDDSYLMQFSKGGNLLAASKRYQGQGKVEFNSLERLGDSLIIAGELFSSYSPVGDHGFIMVTDTTGIPTSVTTFLLPGQSAFGPVVDDLRGGMVISGESESRGELYKVGPGFSYSCNRQPNSLSFQSYVPAGWQITTDSINSNWIQYPPLPKFPAQSNSTQSFSISCYDSTCNLNLEIGILSDSVCYGDYLAFGTSVSNNQILRWKVNGSFVGNSAVDSILALNSGLNTLTLLVEDGACVDSISSIFTVISPQLPSFSYVDSIQATWFSVSNASFQNYSWDFGDNSGGSTLANPVYSYSFPGVYNVCLTTTDSIGCVASVCDTIDLLSLNVTSERQLGPSIFPVPAKSEIILDFKNQVFFEPYQFRVLDLLGNEILASEVAPNSCENRIDVSSLSKGTYFLLLFQRGKVFTYNLVIL